MLGLFFGLLLFCALFVVVIMVVVATISGLDLIAKGRRADAEVPLAVAAFFTLVFVITAPGAIALLQKTVCN